MRNSRQGAIPSDVGALVDRLDDYAERLRNLEAPSGEALSSTVAKLESLVSDIQAQLDMWTASRWTNAQIVADTNARIASAFGGNVNIGGSLYLASTLVAPAVYSTDIGSVAGSRRAVWSHDNGTIGWASSSRRNKVDIEPLDTDADAILSIEPKSFRYRAAVEHYDALPDDEKAGHEPTLEVGFIAEDLHEAGLGRFVSYGSDGEVEGIEYSMFTVALLVAARRQAAEIAELRNRLDRGGLG